jgi:hypothetical protein
MEFLDACQAAKLMTSFCISIEKYFFSPSVEPNGSLEITCMSSIPCDLTGTDMVASPRMPTVETKRPTLDQLKVWHFLLLTILGKLKYDKRFKYSKEILERVSAWTIEIFFTEGHMSEEDSNNLEQMYEEDDRIKTAYKMALKKFGEYILA